MASMVSGCYLQDFFQYAHDLAQASQRRRIMWKMCHSGPMVPHFFFWRVEYAIGTLGFHRQFFCKVYRQPDVPSFTVSFSQVLFTSLP
jgi:hypothetical protein